MSELDRAIRELEREFNRAVRELERSIDQAIRELGRIINRTSKAVLAVFASFLLWTVAEFAVNAALPNLSSATSLVFFAVTLYYIFKEIQATARAKTLLAFIVTLTIVIVDLLLNFGLKLH